MANRDFPRGLEPYSEGGAARPRLTTYKVAASTTIYRGAPLVWVADGTVAMTSTTTGLITVIGVAAHQVTSNAAITEVKVWDDPNQLFTIQADTGTALAATDVFLNGNFVAPDSGNATTLDSICELDSSAVAVTGTFPLRILGKVERVDNTWAEHVDLIVRITPKTHVHSNEASAGI